MKKLIIALILTFLFLNIVACTKEVKVYVCANGKEVMDASECPTNKLAGVAKRDAETYARNYVNGYLAPRGGRAQLVSTYLDPDKGDYFSTFIVTEKEGEPYETVVSIDGKTGQVTCKEKCSYAE